MCTFDSNLYLGFLLNPLRLGREAEMEDQLWNRPSGRPVSARVGSPQRPVGGRGTDPSLQRGSFLSAEGRDSWRLPRNASSCTPEAFYCWFTLDFKCWRSSLLLPFIF